MHTPPVLALRSLILVHDVSGTSPIVSELKKLASTDFDFVHAKVEEDSVRLIEGQKPDLIISIYENGSETVVDFLKVCHGKCPDIPFIVISSEIHNLDLLSLFRNGVSDIILKSELGRFSELTSEALKRSREAKRFRIISDFAFGWEVWESNDKKHDYVSPSCEDISGYSPWEFIEDSSLFERIIVDEDKFIWAEHNHESSLGLQPRREIQFRIKRKDGEIVWIEHSCRPILSECRELLGYRASNRDITKRKLVETDLFDSEKKYRDLFNTATDAIYIQDEKGRFIDVNKGAERMYGYSKEDFIGRTPEFLSAPGKNDQKALDKYVSMAMSGQPQQFEFWGLRSNGQVFPKIVRIQRSTYIGQNVIAAYALDITERKESEMKLLAGEQQLAAIMDQTSQGVTVADLKGNYVLVNPAFCKMMGYSEPELLKLSVFELKKEKGEAGQKSFARSKEKTEGTIVQVELKRKDGTTFLSEVTGKPIRIGDKDLVLGLVTDLTERKKMKFQLLESREKFRELFTRSGDAILFIENGVFVDCNQAAIAMLEYDSKEKFLNTHPSALSPLRQPDGCLSLEKAEEMMQLAKENGTHRFEWVHTKASGNSFPAEVLLTAMPADPNNDVIHCVWRDITDRKKAEIQLNNTLENLEELVAARTSELVLPRLS